MRLKRLTPLLLLCGAGLLLYAGCGRSDRPALGKVSGTVSYRGKPVAAGTLIFEVPGARSAYGKIVDGKIIEVTTFAAGDGVPLGKARIAVFVAAPDESPAAGAKQMDVFKSLIPAKYTDPTTSGLTFDIAAGDNNVVLDLQ